jgi:hypothetical protein
MKELETRKITIDEEYSDGQDLGMDAIAFTKKPAIVVKGVAFSVQEHSVLKFSDNRKMRIAAPIMIPGQIYRNDGEEYYVEFTVETIEDIYKKFMSNLNGNPIFNKEHNSKDIVPAYILEAILIDSENKIKFIKDEYNIDIPMGSVFVVSQITDEKYYNYLVENDMLGFSIEGFLGEFTEQIKNKENEMGKLKFGLPDGEWKMDGKIYIVKDGEVIDIKEDIKEDVQLEDAKEDIKEDVQLEDAKEDIKEDVQLEDAKKDVQLEDATISPAIDEEMIAKLVDARIEVLINEIADLKSQILEIKNVDEDKDKMEFKSQLTPAQKAIKLFEFASKR